MARKAAASMALALISGPSVEASAANPIRKVVTMLQSMQTKVTEEGKKEEDLFSKFMCYCKTSGGDLGASIKTAEEKISSTSAELQAKVEHKGQTEADLKDHQTSRAEAEDTIAKSTSLREKEAGEFAKEKADLETNIAAVAKAVAALEKGMAGAFLQSSAASLLKSFAIDRATLPDATRQELVAFLSGGLGVGYSPQSGEITGILKQMGDEMQKDLADATDAENSATTNYEELVAAKKKELATLQEQIETEMSRTGRLGVEIAEHGNDIEDTQEALGADRKFKAELESSCGTKTAEWEKIKKTRAEELLALAETIKVLNDDASLELFKQTLPSSFVQVQVTAASQRARALALIQASARSSHNPGLDLIALALRGKHAGFEKVLEMIDGMVANLKEEQSGDDAKKEYCDASLDKAEDTQKAQQHSIDDSSTSIDEMQDAVETLASEIKALQDGIRALDKDVSEASDQRRQENEEYKALMAADSTAKDVLAWAKNRLNKFYSPAMYKAPPKRELTEDERITVNMGGSLAPTEAPGGIAGTGIGAAALVQVGAHRQSGVEAPPPPPETFGAYTKKGGEGNGVIAMIDLLVKDLDRQMQEAGVSEKDAQADYETLTQDAGAKRAADAKSLTQKEGAKADTEGALEDEKDKKAATTKELMGTTKHIQDLHATCDWLVKYHQTRKEARASEIDSLTNAKAVLNGADFSLLQGSATTGQLRGARRARQ